MMPRTTDFNIQSGSLGRNFRLSAIHRGEKQRWVDRVLKNDWYYIFKYLDDGSFFAIHKSIDGTKTKLTDKEVKELLCS